MDFPARHIGPRSSDIDSMLSELGYDNVDSFIDAVAPSGIKDLSVMELLPAASETEALAELEQRIENIARPTNMIGLGYHGTVMPEAIKRGVLLNAGWYTAYTPYQPEISQGRLEALLNFQTLVEDLTGLDVAGASLLDEPTAVAEAMTMAIKHGPKGVERIAID